LAPGFQHKGWWYDYITGDSLNVENQLMNIVLKAGEYRVYLDEKIGNPTIISGLEDPDLIVNDYTLFPNPTDSNLSISISLNSSEKLKAFIYNSTGQMVATKEVNLKVGANKIDFDLSFLPEGLYYLNLRGKTLKLTDRFLKL
jgi:hypothetical protein